MSIPDILVIVAALLAIIELFEAKGRSLISWAVLLICIALLYGLL